MLAIIYKRYSQRAWHAFMWAVLLTSVIALTSCQPSVGQQPLPTLPPHAEPTLIAAWTQDWLSSIPCHAPCWYGITPGTTMTSEAVRIIRSLTFVDQGTIKPDYDSPYRGWTWQWLPPIRGRGSLMGYGEDLLYIELDVAEDIPLDNIIAHLGPPHLSPERIQLEGNTPAVYLLGISWPDSSLTLFGSSWKTPPQLHPHIQMKNRIRMYPAQYFDKVPSIPWRGYFSFEDYAQWMRESEQNPKDVP